MYEERRNSFSIRDIILQILLVVLFVFIMVWLFPTKNYLKDNNGIDNSELYANYITSMTEAAKDYFVVSRMPSKVGDSSKLTLKEMLDEKLLLEIGGNANCDLEKSYVEVTKMDVDFQLRVELSCEDYSNYILVTMGCRDYCTECEIIVPGNSGTDNKDENPTQQSTKKYTVTFDSNGGSAVAKQTVVSGKKATKPTNPTRDGYTFVNWTLNGKTYDFNNAVTKNITLVAQWRKNETPVVKYTVTFDSNGGSAVSSQTVESGKTATQPTNPTRDGYTFANWTLNGKVYDFNTVVTGNITLVANWEAVKYTVTFNSNGGSAVSSQTVVSGAKATKPENPTRNGYTFVNWTLNGKAYDFNTAVTGNITLVANWEAVKYTVTFNSNGGSAVSSQTVVSGAKATKPENPTRNGYTFVNWTLNGKIYDFNTAVTGNITLIAQWKKNETPVVKYTVTFNSNGGSAVSSQTVVSGAKATKPTNPTRNGYTFVNWTLNGKTYDFNTVVTGNITLVANWEAVKYTVTFNSNGGSAVSSQTVAYGNKATKPANPTRNGYTFVNWTLNGKTYDFNTAVTGNITLVANWEETLYYQYRKSIPSYYSYYTAWSSWSSTQTYWGSYDSNDYLDTNEKEYKIVDVGSVVNTVEACKWVPKTETIIVDAKEAKTVTSKKYVSAKTKTNTVYGAWTYSGEETSSTPLSTSVSDDATVKYIFKGFKTVECDGCSTSNVYVYYVQTRTATKETEYYCPSGYKEEGSGASLKCYKNVTSQSCSSYGSDYVLEEGGCLKYGTKEVQEQVCEDVPYESPYVKYQYRTRSLETGYTYNYDYDYSTSNNDTSLLNRGYRLTGKVCTIIGGSRTCK